jgi:ATP-dependent protease ClpP protease subunit
MTTNTQKTLQMVYTNDAAVMNICGGITEQLALDFEAAINSAFVYYCYDAVTLKINSPGGSLSGLTHITQCIDYWREKGRCVETQTTFIAASAGALLLALGDMPRREVQRHSTILFHHTRTMGTKDFEITAHDARNLALSLSQFDKYLINQVAGHISQGLHGLKGFVKEGLARCALLKDRADEIAKELRTHAATNLLQPINRIYREMEKTKSVTPYVEFLEERMTLNTVMDVREAYALALIDRVVMVPSLTPQARFIDKGGSAISVVTPFRPTRRTSPSL